MKNAASEKKFLLLLIFLHLAVALPLAFFLNAWMDEASALYTTGQGFSHTFQSVFRDEKQAPLYFLLLSLWRGIDGSIFFARILSIIFSCLAIKFFRNLAEKLFDSETQAKFVTALFALHPFLFWASLEIRGYSLTILVSILLLKFFLEGYWKTSDESETMRAEGKASYSLLFAPHFLFIAAATVALYTNYYLGFLLVGCFAALLILRRFREARNFLFGMLLTGALFLPLFWIIQKQFVVRSIGFQSERSLFAGLKILWSHVLNLIFPTEFSPDVDATEASPISWARIWFVRAGIFLSAFWLAKNSFRQLNEKILAFGTISFVVVAFLLSAYFSLGEIYIALRHTAVLFVPLFLFAALFLAAILPRRREFFIFFAVVFAFLYSYSIYQNYPRLAKRGDWYRVGQFIEAREKPNQPIIVFQNYDALSLPLHYKGLNKILPDEKFFDWNADASLSSAAAFREQIKFVISEIPPEAEEIWLATEEICQNRETSAACQPLENFVQENYTVVITQDFYRERLRLLKKKETVK